jgi:hypothetical protein
MANKRITDLPKDTSVISNKDYLLKIRNGSAYRVEGDTLINSFTNVNSVASVGNGINILTANEKGNPVVNFNSITGTNGITITSHLCSMGVSLWNTPWVTQQMLAANSISDDQLANNTITGTDLALNSITYDNLTSDTQQNLSKAWANFNPQAITSGIGGGYVPAILKTFYNYGFPFNYSQSVGGVSNGGWDSFMNNYAVWTAPGNPLVNQWQTIYRNLNITADGYYTISCQADNTVNIYIDGNLVASSSTFNGGIQNYSVYLKAGLHTLQFNAYNAANANYSYQQAVYGWVSVPNGKRGHKLVWQVVGYQTITVDENTWDTNPAGWACTIKNSAGSLIWDTRTFANGESSTISGGQQYTEGYFTLNGNTTDYVKVTSGSSQGTWFSLILQFNQSILGCIYFITSAALGWKNHPIRITGFSADDHTANFVILQGDYSTGFVAANSNITATALGNQFSYYSDGIRSCYNVSGITRYPGVANGIYNVHFIKSMGDGGYAAAGVSSNSNGIGTVLIDVQYPTYCTVECAITSPMEVFDTTGLSLVVFGN